jgi:hypothetical protein
LTALLTCAMKATGQVRCAETAATGSCCSMPPCYSLLTLLLSW